MYKTILVPIDLAHSEKGKPMIGIARRMGSQDVRIILVNVVEEVPAFASVELPRGTVEMAREQAGKELKAIAKAAGIKSDCDVRTGNAHSTILRVASDHEADLIIIGSHKPGLEDYFIGSTAARVVRHANCTVLVAR
ncbi:MAG: universal stress protein [bacterium]|nr:universal stress protein [bacterium]